MQLVNIAEGVGDGERKLFQATVVIIERDWRQHAKARNSKFQRAVSDSDRTQTDFEEIERAFADWATNDVRQACDEAHLMLCLKTQGIGDALRLHRLHLDVR